MELGSTQTPSGTLGKRGLQLAAPPYLSLYVPGLGSAGGGIVEQRVLPGHQLACLAQRVRVGLEMGVGAWGEVDWG